MITQLYWFIRRFLRPVMWVKHPSGATSATVGHFIVVVTQTTYGWSWGLWYGSQLVCTANYAYAAQERAKKMAHSVLLRANQEKL